MKKILSIFLIGTVVLSSLNLTLATHFCGGKIAAAKISLNGTNVSCGMESTINNHCPSHSILSPASCCKNTSKVLSVDRYQISDRLEVQKIDFKLLQVFLVPVCQFLFTSSNSPYFADVGYYHPLQSLAERLAFICIFRK